MVKVGQKILKNGQKSGQKCHNCVHMVYERPPKAIKKQTEKSADLIGEKRYQIRKRDNGIVISISIIQWAVEVLHTLFTLLFFHFFQGISNYADKYFTLYLFTFTMIVQPSFYLNGDATFRRKLDQDGFLSALKSTLFE